MGAPGDEVRGGNPDLPLAIIGDPGEEVATGWLHGCVEGRDGVAHGQPRSGAGRTRDGRGDLREGRAETPLLVRSLAVGI